MCNVDFVFYEMININLSTTTSTKTILTQGDRPNYRSSGYSEELNVQNVSYFMLFLSCSETSNKKEHYAKRKTPHRM